MSALRAALGDYLTLRRQLGFQLVGVERLLTSFVGYAEREGSDQITTELAVAWAKLPADARAHTWRQRLGSVRGFAHYVATLDPATEVPSRDLLPGRQRRLTPFIYSPAEIDALMRAAAALTPALKGATYETLIGLLAVTGLRPGEARGLDRADVDLRAGVLTVRAAKRGKHREVPLHESTTQVLAAYARRRDRLCPKPTTAAFFVSAEGRRVVGGTFNQTFVKLVARAGLEARGARVRPRPHDLRHTYAVRTLLDWHHRREDVDARLPLLSTYLGHAAPAHTYWYLSAAPELMGLIGQRLDRVLGDQS